MYKKVAYMGIGSSLILIVVLGLVFFSHKNARSVRADAPLLPAEVEFHVMAVNKITSLPDGEEPEVSKVIDADKVHKLPFYKDAEDGDIVLTYSDLKKAYLYRPATNQVINYIDPSADK